MRLSFHLRVTRFLRNFPTNLLSFLLNKSSAFLLYSVRSRPTGNSAFLTINSCAQDAPNFDGNSVETGRSTQKLGM